jgi:hypothetical protein
MDKPEFDIEYHRIYFCDHPDCMQQPTAEVRLIGSGLGHAQVCRHHVIWAQQDLVKRDAAAPAAAPGGRDE